MSEKNVKLKSIQGVEVDGFFYSKETVKQLPFETFKMLLAFIDDEKTFTKVANWHSEEAVFYAQEVLRSLK